MAGRNEVTIDVVVREHGGKKTLKDLGDESKKTGASFGQMAKDSKTLQKQLFDMDLQIRKTAQEMERTGDTSLVKSIQKQRRELNALVKVRKDILGIAFGDKDDGGKQGGGIGRSAGRAAGAAGSGLTDSLMALRGPGVVAAATLGVTLAPAIGGVIASAVLGGVGTGGIIGGLALAAQDSRVQDAGAKLGQHAMAAFSRSAEPFVGPAVEAIGVLRGVVDDVSGDMRQAFATIAPTLVPLTQGIGGFFHQMMPGIIKALEGARPVMLIIGHELPKIGRAFGQFLSKIAEDPRGAIQAFQDLSHIIQSTIILTGNFIAFLADVWGKLGPIIRAAQGDVPGMAAALGDSKLAMNAAAAMANVTADSLAGMGESAQSAKERITGLNSALDGFFDRTMNLRGANREYEASIDTLVETIHQNGKVWTEATEKGRANQQAIDDTIRSIKELRQANIDNGMTVEQANAIYDQQLEQLRKTLIKLGLNKQAVNNLIDAIKAIPGMAEIEVRAPGLVDVLKQARELAALLGSNAAAARFRAGDTSGYGGGRASGGFMAPGMTYDVAESGTGVERVKMLRGGGAVVANADQWSAAGGWTGSGGGGGGVQTLVIRVESAGGEWNDLIARSIRVQVADIGGGDVQRTYGRRMN